MQRMANGVARATGATRDSSTTEDAQGFLRMFPGVVKIALERMFHTCCRDFSLQRASRSMLKQVFFCGFSLVFSVFRVREGLQVGPQLGAMLEVVLGGALEPCWEVFGRFLEAKMPPRRSKLAPRRPKMASKMMQKMIC